MVLAILNTKETHDLCERDKPVTDVSTKYGEAQRQLHLWGPSGLAVSLPVLC